MPVTTRRNPSDSDERAQQDDLPAVGDAGENPQDQLHPGEALGTPGAGSGRATGLFGRMRASLGGLGATEGSDEEGDVVAAEPG